MIQPRISGGAGHRSRLRVEDAQMDWNLRAVRWYQDLADLQGVNIYSVLQPNFGYDSYDKGILSTERESVVGALST